jgi:hypothetical protein
MAARRHIPIDPHDRSVGPDPDEVEREAHRERVDRAAAQSQRALGRQLVQPAEPAPARVEPARVVDAQPVGQLVRRQPPEPSLPPAHRRLAASSRSRATNSSTATLPSSPAP